jgi:hypothetical protein
MLMVGLAGLVLIGLMSYGTADVTGWACTPGIFQNAGPVSARDVADYHFSPYCRALHATGAVDYGGRLHAPALALILVPASIAACGLGWAMIRRRWTPLGHGLLAAAVAFSALVALLFVAARYAGPPTV